MEKNVTRKWQGSGRRCQVSSIKYQVSSVKCQVVDVESYASRITHHILRVALLAIILISLFIWLPVSLLAQSVPDAEVDFYVKSPESGHRLTVGDQITLRLEIRHPTDSRVVLPQLEEQWDGFIVVDQTPPETIDRGDGTATTGKDIVVALFQPGEYETPSIVVTHRKPDGAVEELAAPIIPIRITSVITEGSELRDLKPQAELEEPIIWPLILAGVLAALLLTGLLAALGLWLYRRRQARPVPAFVPVPFADTRPPEIIAHAELDRIEALNLPARHQIKEHYSLVAACLRRYIEGRYRIPALEQTTTELRDAFRKSDAPTQDVNALMSVMTESDWVKFARYIPLPGEVHGLIDRARTVIDTTTPEPEPVPPSPPPAEREEVPV